MSIGFCRRRTTERATQTPEENFQAVKKDGVANKADAERVIKAAHSTHGVSSNEMRSAEALVNKAKAECRIALDEVLDGKSGGEARLAKAQENLKVAQYIQTELRRAYDAQNREQKEDAEAGQPSAFFGRWFGRRTDARTSTSRHAKASGTPLR